MISVLIGVGIGTVLYYLLEEQVLQRNATEARRDQQRLAQLLAAAESTAHGATGDGSSAAIGRRLYREFTLLLLHEISSLRGEIQWLGRLWRILLIFLGVYTLLSAYHESHWVSSFVQEMRIYLWELLVWLCSAPRVVFSFIVAAIMSLPVWARVVLVIWIVFTLGSSSFRRP